MLGFGAYHRTLTSLNGEVSSGSLVGVGRGLVGREDQFTASHFAQ